MRAFLEIIEKDAAGGLRVVRRQEAHSLVANWVRMLRAYMGDMSQVIRFVDGSYWPFSDSTWQKFVGVAHAYNQNKRKGPIPLTAAHPDAVIDSYALTSGQHFLNQYDGLVGTITLDINPGTNTATVTISRELVNHLTSGSLSVAKVALLRDSDDSSPTFGEIVDISTLDTPYEWIFGTHIFINYTFDFSFGGG